uniref:non-specific serine/threonine protein kinase n=1 Tax=Sinocyclocheilus rhinocerous TaxID=307959 RepID=A0A673GYS9_9TELE
MIPECPRTTEPRSRIRCESGQNRSGLLREIRTAVRSEPFTERYDVIPGKELGRGKFAVVRKCVEKSTGKTYAAKYMRKRRKGQDCRTEILHEIGVLELAAACPRVVNLHQVYETACEMVLLLEYINCAVPYSVINGQDHVRLLNIEVESHPIQLRKYIETELRPQTRGSAELEHADPPPSDRSIGVLAYVMLTGISPFLGDDKQETFLNISQINISYTEEELQHLDRAAIHFIKSLLIKEPESRATAEDCLKHQWLQPEEACLESVSEPVGPADEDEEEEELIVMAAYTLGQCRQSSDEPSLTPDQKAISKRFKFEEPFSARPGEFIY